MNDRGAVPGGAKESPSFEFRRFLSLYVELKPPGFHHASAQRRRSLLLLTNGNYFVIVSVTNA